MLLKVVFVSGIFGALLSPRLLALGQNQDPEQNQNPAQDQEELKAKAEAVVQHSCGFCHVKGVNDLVWVDSQGEVDWAFMTEKAEEIITVVEAKKMPPRFAPSGAQITEEERADLLAYVRLLQEGEEKPLPKDPDTLR